MLYSQKQVLTGLEVPASKYRYWAGAIPSLASRAGKSAKLTFGDILALAFTKRLCDEFGVAIGSVAPAIQDLFEKLNGRAWIGLEGSWLKITQSSAEFVARRGQILTPGENAVFIECAPVVDAARAKFTPTMPDQLRLTFGPKAVGQQK